MELHAAIRAAEAAGLHPKAVAFGTARKFPLFYFSDSGDLLNLRYNRWKIVFAEQRAEGFDVWQEPFTFLRLPKIFDLRADPFERADHVAIGYAKWRIDRTYLLVPAQAK
jgi:arylsulfatase